MEYIVENVNSHPPTLQGWLNDKAAAGWELVSAFDVPGSMRVKVIMHRAGKPELSLSQRRINVLADQQARKLAGTPLEDLGIEHESE